MDAKDINRQRFNRALSEWTKLERTSLCTRTVQGIAIGLRRRAYMYQCRIPGRVERVPTEYNIADVHSKPTNGVVQRTIGMAVMGHDKIWPDVDPTIVTTKNKAIE